MEIPSLKKETVYGYSAIPSIQALETNKLTLVTAAGIIIGTPVKDDVDSDADADVEMLKTVNSTIIDNYRHDNNIEENKPTSGNDGFIELKDVTLISGSTRSNFKFLNVFFDQIIAVTIANIEN